jgi:RNA polymerase sigma-70 factor (ECF subfamily)
MDRSGTIGFSLIVPINTRAFRPSPSEERGGVQIVWTCRWVAVARGESYNSDQLGHLRPWMGVAMPVAGRQAVRANGRTLGRRGCAESAAVLADLDTQLMLEAQAGNREAANALVERNFARISGYISHLIGDRRQAEDLTQDVFMRALGRGQPYEPTAKVSVWLYRMATNAAFNYVKRPDTKRRAAEPAAETWEPADGRASAPDQLMDQAERRAQVAAALRDLPLNQRVALTLFLHGGCSYEQIGSVLDVTVESVRSMLWRARAELRARLNGLL